MALLTKLRRMRFHEDESGSSLLEFTLSATVLLMIIFGIMDGSRALYADHYVSEMAREATRYAMVRGSTWAAACTSAPSYNCKANNDNITSYVKGITPMGVNPGSLTVATTWPGTNASGAACITINGMNSPGCIVTSKLSYNFNFVLPFLPTNTLVLTSTSSVTIQQ